MGLLATNRRTAREKWVARRTSVAPQLSAEVLVLSAEATQQAVLLDWDKAYRFALVAEADPLFFRWQREEATHEDWLASVAAVRVRYPPSLSGSSQFRVHTAPTAPI